ncbi:MAG: molybdopterin-guanine dinucleotide biosynthesis protein B [Aeoliella sp.]
MNRVHIIGGKNHGKTTLVSELVQQLSDCGYRVGTIKHTHHQHELDAPGKDSHRHREAGASVVGILSRSMNAVFWEPHSTNPSIRDQRYDGFVPMFDQCDLVIVEGDSQTMQPKIEVWRESLGTQPLAEKDASITAVVTNDELQISLPVWPRSDVPALATKILSLATK